MLFIDCVNRIFRYNGIIRGDTDAITSFSQTQHQASLQLAMIAVQDELTDLIAEKMIPYERGEGTLTMQTNTRTYSLPNDFRSFSGFPHFYDSTQNTMIPPYKGGLDQLELDIPNYKTQTGYPSWWYWDPTTTKVVGFFQTPDLTLNGRALTYEYEKSVLVSTQNDTIPFH